MYIPSLLPHPHRDLTRNIRREHFEESQIFILDKLITLFVSFFSFFFLEDGKKDMPFWMQHRLCQLCFAFYCGVLSLLSLNPLLYSR